MSLSFDNRSIVSLFLKKAVYFFRSGVHSSLLILFVILSYHIDERDLSYMSNLKLEFKFKFKFRLWFRMRASVCERRAYCLNEGVDNTNLNLNLNLNSSFKFDTTDISWLFRRNCRTKKDQ